MSNGHQVGDGLLAGSNASQALLWSGTVASAIDLTPSSVYGAVAKGSADGMQVGRTDATAGTQYDHAALWLGSASSWIDLDPNAGFGGSEAWGVANGFEVGYEYTGGGGAPFSARAFLWADLPG